VTDFDALLDEAVKLGLRLRLCPENLTGCRFPHATCRVCDGHERMRSPAEVLYALIEAGVSVRTTRTPVPCPDCRQYYQAGTPKYGGIRWHDEENLVPVVAAMRAWIAVQRQP